MTIVWVIFIKVNLYDKVKASKGKIQNEKKLKSIGKKEIKHKIDNFRIKCKMELLGFEPKTSWFQ